MNYVKRIYAKIGSSIYNGFVYKCIYSNKNVSPRNFLRKIAFRFLRFHPRTIKLHINNECNQSCKNCYDKTQVDLLTSEEIFSILDQIKEITSVSQARLDLLGGEPVLRKDLLEIANYAKHKARIGQVQLFTNGTLLTLDLARQLIKSGVDAVLITLHSHKKEIHDMITQSPGSWEKAMNGLMYCLQAGIRAYSFTILSSYNMDCLDEFDYFIKAQGLKPVYFPYIRQSKNDSMHIEDKSAFLDSLHWSIGKSGVKKDELLKILAVRNKICPAFVSTIRIKANGAVTPCPFLDLELGSIRKDALSAVFKMAYNNKDLGNFLSVPEECLGCSIVKMCGGGCKASRFTLYKQTQHKDLNCPGPYSQKISINELSNYLPCYFFY